MSTKNLIKKENRFAKDYFARVVSNDDPLKRGRLQVKLEAIMGNIPFWVNCTNQIGKVNFQLIPEPEDIVTVKFKNKDIYSGEWELKGNPIDGTEQKNIDPKKYGLYDEQGNFILIDRATNDISVTAMNDYNITVKNCCNVIIEVDANVTVNGNVTQQVQGDVSQTISGSVTQTVNGSVTQNISGTTDITCPQTTITGALHVTGLVSSDTDFRQAPNNVGLITHVHPYVKPAHPGGTDDTEIGKN